MELREPARPIRFTTNTMKLIAILAMLIDHLPYAVAPAASSYVMPWILFHLVGRLTAPIMFYSLVEGYHRTRNANRYALRLLLFAAISYVPYIYYFEEVLPNSDNFTSLNVLFTLFAGLMTLRAKNEIKNPLLRYPAMAACMIPFLFTEWNFFGILIILVFEYFRGDKRAFTIGYVFVICGYIAHAADNYLLWRIPNISTETLSTYLPYLLVLSCMLLPILLIRRADTTHGQRAPLTKWGFYIFYPAHLLLLIFLRWLIA